MASGSFCAVDSAVEVLPGAHKTRASVRRPIRKFMCSLPPYPSMADCRFSHCQEQVDAVSPFVAEEGYEVSRENAKHVKLKSGRDRRLSLASVGAVYDCTFPSPHFCHSNQSASIAPSGIRRLGRFVL